ncbi:MAG TPA: AbrB/MazE/SpoVT family DNA-binding domain-containing protein [Anaerolineae bacterium]|nr:AbrB/MazE/SpoVT family DNA-binding domain-containing protein [Anaerolineae bacterium]
MITARVRHRGQITIPQSIRRRLDLQEGDQVAFVQQGENVILQPLTDTIFDLRGSVPVSGPQDFAAIRQRVIADHARKVAQGEA